MLHAVMLPSPAPLSYALNSEPARTWVLALHAVGDGDVALAQGAGAAEHSHQGNGNACCHEHNAPLPAVLLRAN